MADVAKRPELWAGVECTVNRVGNIHHDQLKASGHCSRPDDPDHFAALGIRTMRVPVLWERVATSTGAYDWNWSDAYLARLQELGIEPIVGLLHHGSGPLHTDLLDPAFPEKFATYAAAVCARYPHVRQYTPINEPLTTARFSGLYGHWYPHHRSDASFLLALVNQCWATVLAMRRIREQVPGARLVQTEDLGVAQGDAGLAYQVAFENDRRWLTWDLLTGRVDPGHPLWSYLSAHVDPSLLLRFQEDACPPEVIGIDHYVESDRYLSLDVDRHPGHSVGGNGIDAYADVAAPRSGKVGGSSFADLLVSAWERYRIPVALTEVQLACTREEQMRWLHEAWIGACEAATRGVEVRAITAWGLLGHYDWDSLLTRAAGSYAPGVFDVRSGVLQPTALAGMLRSMADGTYVPHAVVQGGRGWWNRSSGSPVDPSTTRPILITGGKGTLGRAFARLCERRDLPHVLTDRSVLDIADEADIRAVLHQVRPWAVVNAAGMVDIELAERYPERCMRENAHGAIALAKACAREGIRYLTFSSDQVFNADGEHFLFEEHPTAPVNAYGRSKLTAEEGVRHLAPDSLIVRTAAFFGPWDEHHFVHQFLRQAKQHGVVRVRRGRVSPTYVPDLVDAALDLLIDGIPGIRHLTNPGSFTWRELAALVVARYHPDPASIPIEEIEVEEGGTPHPFNTALGTIHGASLPPFEHAFERYLREKPFIHSNLHQHVPE